VGPFPGTRPEEQTCLDACDFRALVEELLGRAIAASASSCPLDRTPSTLRLANRLKIIGKGGTKARGGECFFPFRKRGRRVAGPYLKGGVSDRSGVFVGPRGAGFAAQSLGQLAIRAAAYRQPGAGIIHGDSASAPAPHGATPNCC